MTLQNKKTFRKSKVNMKKLQKEVVLIDKAMGMGFVDNAMAGLQTLLSSSYVLGLKEHLFV